jgi:hypothetical protein
VDVLDANLALDFWYAEQKRLSDEEAAKAKQEQER